MASSLLVLQSETSEVFDIVSSRIVLFSSLEKQREIEDVDDQENERGRQTDNQPNTDPKLLATRRTRSTSLEDRAPAASLKFDHCPAQHEPQ